MHELRCTFIMLAEGLDIPVCVIKRLVNHMIDGAVTAGNIVPDGESLRWAIQEITGYFLSGGGLSQPTKIITLHDAEIVKHIRSRIA